MLKPFIVYYKYKCPGDKKPGAVKQFRIYAEDAAQARKLAAERGNYPDIEILEVKAA